MLAPLKDRSILELDPGDDAGDAPLPAPENEHQALILALRKTRRTLRWSALTATRKIMAQNSEIDRLNQLNATLSKRLADLESGQAMTQLGQKLMALCVRNEQLTAATERLSLLDKALCLAKTECDYLVQECEIAIVEIDR